MFERGRDRSRQRRLLHGDVQPAAPPRADPGPSQVEALLMQQNGFLQQQLAVLQAQVRMQSETLQFQQPQILATSKVDPEVSKRFKAWEKETKTTLALHDTHRQLTAKYAKLVADKRLHTHFEAEARFKWQWPRTYLAVAEMTPQEAEQDDGMAEYDLEKSWQKMRQRHARECMDFVVAHQARCAEFLEAEAAEQKLYQNLMDKITDWAATFADGHAEAHKYHAHIARFTPCSS